MNNAQKFVYWLDRKTSVFEKIETSRADWFENKFRISDWLRESRLILDIGAGVCDITRKLQENTKGKVIGIDIEDFRRIGNKTDFNFQFCISNASLLPFREKSFDCVTAFWTLHHLNDPLLVLQEIDRILKVGSQLIILEDLIDNTRDFNGYFTKIYDKVINLEFSSHPHSNKSLDQWNKTITEKFNYQALELLEIPWFTRFNLLKFGLLRYIKR